KIARMEGGYHGTHDYAEVSTHPAAGEGGPAEEPEAVADSLGTPAWAIEEVVVLPFNHPDAAERIIRREGLALAAVIVEPIIGAGGVIAATPEFLGRLREVTRELGILLIFDEVISFRVAPGGAQQMYGVTPDLTTLGKIIGGGLPVAAFGGRADVMQLLDPRNKPNIPQGGTYNGNALGMAAGLAGMKELRPDVYDDLNRKGARVCEQLAEVFASHHVPVQVNGAGSMLALHFTDTPVVDYRTMAAADKKKTRDLMGVAGADVVDKAADARLVGDERTGLDARDRLFHIVLEIGERLQREGGPDTGLLLDLALEVVVVKREHAAVRVVDQDDLLG